MKKDFNVVNRLIQWTYVSAKPTEVDFGIIFGPYGDQTGSISDAEKVIAKKIVQKYDISKTAALVGAIVYGNDATLAWKLGDATNLKSTLSKIDLLTRPRYGNNILASLQLARDTLFSTVNGARRDVPKTLILFTSKTDGTDKRLEATANSLKERGINVIVIATGSDINTKDLAGIASDQTKLIVTRDLTNTAENASQIAASNSIPGDLFSFS